MLKSKSMAIYPIILAGGFGARLWPISRQCSPKQFVKLIGEHTLFQQAVERIRGFVEVVAPVIVCNSKHYDLVAEQLHAIGINNAQIIIESVGKGTAPAIAVAAFKLMVQGHDPLLLVLPADHVIADVLQFHKAIATAKKYALRNFLVCFGVIPSRPEVGYGYIKFGEQLHDDMVFRVARFVEKPDVELAKQYMSSGEYYWNSGIYMFHASVYLQELKQHAIDIYQVCKDVVYSNTNLTSEIFKVENKQIDFCRSDSVDCAIMEKTKNAVAVPIDIGWSDLGSWQALWEFCKKDDAGNVIVGDVNNKNTSNSYIHATGRKIVVLGIRNCVIIETRDAVLISAKDCCQDIRSVIDAFKK